MIVEEKFYTVGLHARNLTSSVNDLKKSDCWRLYVLFKYFGVYFMVFDTRILRCRETREREHADAMLEGP